jgi:cytochrome P450
MSPASSGIATLDLTDPTAFIDHDPHEFWRIVRERDPVHWHECGAGRPGFWVVAGHADVVFCYTAAEALSSARGTVLDVLLTGDDAAGGKMLAVTDRPHHHDLRAVMWRAFSPRVIRRVSRGIHDYADRLVRQVAELDTFDFATEVAEHIPMNTICDLLSIPEHDRTQLLAWNKLALSADESGTDRMDSLEARNEIVLYFMDLAQERRADPGDDVVSMIATAEVDGRPLPLEEVAVNCYSIILGGDESSRMSAICGAKALAEHPAQWRALRAGEVDLTTAVEEILRWATPAMHFARTASRNLIIGDRLVRKGDIVTMWNISANNDESVFDAPRTFDLSRFPNRHIAFGHGPHYCLGAALGRAELHALLAALVKSVRDIELCGAPTRIYSNFLYGYSSLPLSLRPR